MRKGNSISRTLPECIRAEKLRRGCMRARRACYAARAECRMERKATEDTLVLAQTLYEEMSGMLDAVGAVLGEMRSIEERLKNE